MIQSLQTSFQDFPICLCIFVFFHRTYFRFFSVGFVCRKLLSLANKCCCKKRQVERQGTTTRTAAWLTTSPTTSPTTSLNDKSDDKSNDKSGDKSDDMHPSQSHSNKGAAFGRHHKKRWRGLRPRHLFCGFLCMLALNRVNIVAVTTILVLHADNGRSEHV